MKEVNGALFYTFAYTLEKINLATSRVAKHGDSVIDSEEWTEMKSLLLHYCKTILPSCKDVGLDVSVILLEQIIRELPSNEITGTRVAEYVRDLQNRLSDEMRLLLFIHMPYEKVHYYEEPNLFGVEVSDRFPSAIIDIEEAGKCFAFSRHTACVMHLMRVIEIGLRAVAKGLEIPQAELLPTWQAVISKIEAQMRVAANKRDADWLKIEPFYREIPAHLFAIKNAWRNPSMHVQTSYDEERALDIYNAVRGFMRYIATELSE